MTALVKSGDNLVFIHSAFGAEKSRYSVNFGKNWTEWRDWEDSTAIPKSAFKNKKFFWKGDHAMMNCELSFTLLLSNVSDIMRRFQIGQRPQALLLPSYTLISDMTNPVASLVSSPEESSIGSVLMKTFRRNWSRTVTKSGS